MSDIETARSRRGASGAIPVFARAGHVKSVPAKTKSELLGLVEGIMADHRIVTEEAQFLRRWILEREGMRDIWPGNVLDARIAAMLADGVLDDAEHKELMGILGHYLAVRETAALVKESISPDAGPITRTTLDSPFDDPPPPIEHMGRSFVVTGEFVSGSRADVVSRIEVLGGTIASSVSKRVHFLIVGEVGSDYWKGGAWGTKIEKAVELRRAGVPVRVVREQHWYESAVRAEGG